MVGIIYKKHSLSKIHETVSLYSRVREMIEVESALNVIFSFYNKPFYWNILKYTVQSIVHETSFSPNH